MFFLLIKPAKEELAKLDERYKAAEPIALQEPQARRELDEAIRKVNETTRKLEVYMNAKMPNLDFSDRAKGMVQLWHEQIETLGPLLESYINRSGVKLISPNITVPAPPVNPNDPVFSQPVITVPVGQVQVQGNFRQIMDHIRKWNNCNRLVMVDLPTLTGNSPTLQAAYNLTVFIFPRREAGPTVAMAGAGGPGGTAVGAPPTMPAAMPSPSAMPPPGGPPTVRGLEPPAPK